MKNITFTFDLEDHRAEKNGKYNRIESNCYKVLEWLEQKNIKGTFFVLGSVAQQFPKLILNISKQGHEIGSHSYDHKYVINETPQSFKENVAKSKKIIEDITNKKVSGFRAPFFSITNETLWATEVLKDLGFTYSSSVVPKKYKSFGVNEVPNCNFIWPSGLLELPMMMGSLLGIRFPCIGGVYLRLLPMSLIKFCLPREGVLWTYLHPYDIDKEEPFTKIHGTGHLGNLLLYLNRSNALIKAEQLMQNYQTLTFIQRINNGEFKFSSFPK